VTGGTGSGSRWGEDVWQGHDLVFPTGVGTPIEPRSLNRHFDGIRTLAGLPGVRLHDLRHPS
jgi:hypothetical protein